MSDGLKLISAVLATGSVGTLSGLERDTLLDEEQTVYDFVRSHYRQYRDLPATQTVQSELGIRLPTANETLQYYVDRVGERHDYNLIRDRFATLRDGLSAKDMTAVSETVNDMSRVLRRRRRTGAHAGEVVDIGQGMQQVVSRLSSVRGTGGISGITTGWDRYDMITGGYQKADLISWVGRMGLGKTYVMLRQAQKAHEVGENVLVVTTEMAIEQLSRRLAALHLGINPTLLKTGMISTHMERRIRSLVTGIAGSERFKLFSVGLQSKVSAIEALCQEFGPSAVYVDGVYLLRPTEYSKNMTQRDKVTMVFDELKALTLEADAPFIVSTQLNRQAGKGGKDASLETIGFSDAIGTHSSIVVALKDGTTVNPKDSREFDFLKGREGESGKVEINFKFAPLDMSERDPEEESGGSDDTSSSSVEWMGVRRRAA